MISLFKGTEWSETVYHCYFVLLFLILFARLYYNYVITHLIICKTYICTIDIYTLVIYGVSYRLFVTTVCRIRSHLILSRPPFHYIPLHINCTAVPIQRELSNKWHQSRFELLKNKVHCITLVFVKVY